MSGPDFEVRGGAHDIEANVDDMRATGAELGRLGVDVGEVAVRAHGVLVDGDLLRSAPFSPGSFASAEGAVLGALDGPGGLTSTALRVSAAGVTMQARAHAWAAFDASREFGEELRHWAQGRLALPLLLSPAGAGATALYLWHEGAFDDPQRFLLEHPDLVEEIVASSPYALSFYTLGVYPYDVASASGLLAMLYDNGTAHTRRVADPHGFPPPRSLQESLENLDEFDDPGTFQIQLTYDAQGRPLYNVYLPGTKVFDTPVVHESELIQNMGTNLAAVAGVDNTYEDAVLDAMRDAGIPGDARVLFTGHSQGGIVAARMAQKLTDPQSGYPQYNVTDVVTAGSPVDHIEIDERVRVLSLVNEYDVVARLDGEKYRDSSNHTTIVTHRQSGTVTGNHLLADTYAPMAGQLAASDDPAVRDALAAVEDFYPSGDRAERYTTYSYRMERDR